MEITTRFLQLPVFLLLVIMLVACSSQGQGDDLSKQLQAYEDGQSQARLIYVEAFYEAGEGQAALSIDRAVVFEGSPPFLLDNQALEGQVELLNEQGRSLWSMGYEPLKLDVEPFDNDRASLRNRLILRLPYYQDARRVRLTESGRGLSVESEILLE